MDHARIASRLIEARKRSRFIEDDGESSHDELGPENILKSATEYSCHMEISLSSDFEGDVSKGDLIKKVKTEVIAAIKTGMEQVARDLGISGTGIVVKPLKVDCVINGIDVDDGDEDLMSDEADYAAPDMPKRRKKR